MKIEVEDYQKIRYLYEEEHMSEYVGDGEHLGRCELNTLVAEN